MNLDIIRYTLKIYIDSDDEYLKQKYLDAVEKHNNNDKYCDSGFDLYTPVLNDSNSEGIRQLFRDEQKIKINFKVKCAMFENYSNIPMGYYLYSRSSITKTPLRLANKVGIIDSGYRGNIIGVFDNLYYNLNDEKYDIFEPRNFIINPYDRFLQICAGDLRPFSVELVDTPEELGITERMDGGFGSTGK